MNLDDIYLQKVRELDLKVDSLQLEAIRSLQEIIDQILVNKKQNLVFLKDHYIHL
ncbi:ATPase [Francisella orientalis LADL 07-285A]|nr:ATPase [Francisella orientalis LADL 07-285A]